jgi:hypothetical protein
VSAPGTAVTWRRRQRGERALAAVPPGRGGSRFRSVAALPLRLRLRDQTIGGLNLFDEHADPLPPADPPIA